MKKLIILIILLFANFRLPAQQELDNYLKTASENNAGVKAAFSEYRSALELLPQAKALPDPEIMFRYFITPLLVQKGKQRFTLSASQMFPWFGTLKAQEQAAAESAKSKYESFINKRNQLFMDVERVYFNYYVQQKSVEITSNTLKLYKSMRELARINFESGNGSFVNVLRADMVIAEVENSLAYLIDNELPIKSEFEKLLNAKMDGPILIPDTLWRDSLSETKSSLMDSIASNNPELKKMEFEITALEKQTDVAKKMGLPSFSIGGTYMNMSKRPGDIPNNGMDMFMFPEIGFTIPISRNKYKAMIDESKYKTESASYEKTEKINELNSELESAYRDYLNAQRSVALFSRLHNLAQNARELLLASFSAGGLDFEEVLRMQQQELIYTLHLEESRSQLNMSVAKINYLTGKE